MPHKHNAGRRHHIPKKAHCVTNWPEYEAGLRSQGSPTLWITSEALTHWQALRRTTPGGQPRYSDLAIETTLMLGSALQMRLRQAEGLLGSVVQLMGLTLPVPGHTTLSRRAKQRPAVSRAQLPEGLLDVLIDSTGLQVYGAGQWLQEKHGVKSRRRWRKLHLAVNAGTGQIVAHTLIDQEGDDPSQVAPLLDQIPGEIGRFIADGAYDGAPTYQTVARHSAAGQIVIPPRSTGLAEGDRLWSASSGRNHDGPLQGADRPASAGSSSRCSADRSSYRRGGAQPHAGLRTPEVRPL
jgi:hypothetical protein